MPSLKPVLRRPGDVGLVDAILASGAKTPAEARRRIRNLLIVAGVVFIMLATSVILEILGHNGGDPSQLTLLAVIFFVLMSLATVEREAYYRLGGDDPEP